MKTPLLAFAAVAMARMVVPAQPPVITAEPTNRVVWAGCNVSFAVGVFSGEPVTCQWRLNGTNVPNNIISTVAGNGSSGFSGDGGAATNARLESLSAVSLDNLGNLLLPDPTKQRVRKVDVAGLITTIAGGGTNGLGDGGPATNAALSNPGQVAVDALGNLFIPDQSHQCIRRVDPSGIISTVAGTGVSGFSGDGGPATNANFANPVGVAVDVAGNLFIADFSNRRVRMVDTNGLIWTVAGNGTFGYAGDGGPATNASMYAPYRVAVDSSGDLFFVDGPRIRKVDANGVITTLAGNGANSFSGDGGAATNASLNEPKGVGVDTQGNVFIADSGNYRIRKVDTNGVIATVAGTNTSNTEVIGDGGPATSAWISFPYDAVVDGSGNLFIADTDNFRVRKVTNTQGPTLALNEVTADKAGAYQVVVTSSGGSVTSTIATLTVATAPLVYQTVMNKDGTLTLGCVSPPASTNVVLCSSIVPSPGPWQTMATNAAGMDGNWRYTDTNAANSQTRFYRFAVP